MTAYYNEIDPFAAQWLRNLISQGHIAPGDVDTRSIEDVRPRDLHGYTQCHFFAGIGVWSHAMRSARWDDSRPVWTGSCPCQSFSVAGKGDGFADQRHLWPAFFHLIEQCRPATVFGEQVEAAIRYSWLDLVQTDLEKSGYAFAAASINSAGFGAPHIRQRLYFVAHSGQDFDAGKTKTSRYEWTQAHRPTDQSCGRGISFSSMAHHHHQGSQGWPGVPECAAELAVGESGLAGGLGESNGDGCESRSLATTPTGHGYSAESASIDAGFSRPTNGHWRDVDWIKCRDGKWRPVEPGTQPLAPRTPGHVGRLRGYGNAITAPVAQHFIEAAMESI